MTNDNASKAWEIVHRIQVDRMNDGTAVMLPWEPVVDTIAELLDRIDELEKEMWEMA